jgi:hypothetical protein
MFGLFKKDPEEDRRRNVRKRIVAVHKESLKHGLDGELVIWAEGIRLVGKPTKTIEEEERSAERLEDWVRVAKVKVFVRRSIKRLREDGVVVDEPTNIEVLRKAHGIAVWGQSLGPNHVEWPPRVFAVSELATWMMEPETRPDDWSTGELAIVLDAFSERSAIRTGLHRTSDEDERSLLTVQTRKPSADFNFGDLSVEDSAATSCSAAATRGIQSN